MHCGAARYAGTQAVGIPPTGPCPLGAAGTGGAAATWNPAGDGVMLYDNSSGRLRWVQPSGVPPCQPPRSSFPVTLVPPCIVAKKISAACEKFQAIITITILDY